MITAKRIAGAVVLAGAAFMAQGAMAADISNPDTVLDLGTGGDVFGQHFTGSNAGNSFAERYTFTLSSAGSIFADTFSSSGNAKNGLDILGLSLFNADGLVLKGTQLSTGKTDQWELSTSSLAAGNYFLLVSGTVLSNASGAYTGSLSVSPVPEPATYGMMLGGLALVGALASRRRKSSQAA